MMKKYLLAIFVSLLAFASCTKGLEEDPIDGNNPIDNNAINQVTTVLTFSGERPQLDPSTKTAWDADTKSIVWSANDIIRIGFKFNDAWWAQTAEYSSENESPNNNIKFYKSDAVTIDSDNNSIGTFDVPISNAFTGPTTSGDFVFYSFYPGTLVNVNNQNDAPDIFVTLNSYQYPEEDSFDPKTDLLVGNSHTITTSEPGFPTETIDLYWTRVVAHGYFTLKNFQRIEDFEENETISKVVFTAQEDANLTGNQKISLATGVFLGNGSSNTVTLDGTNLEFVKELDPETSEEQTNLKVWLSVMPETLTALAVEVVTNKATYTRSWTGINKTLKGNARNTMGLNMAAAERNETPEYYWVRKELSAINNSDVFVIVGKLSNGSTYALSNDKGESTAPDAVPVTVTADGEKLTAEPAERIQWTKTGSSYYTFYSKVTPTDFLYCTDANNGVHVGPNGDHKTFQLSNGYLRHRSTRRYLGIYNAQDWRCYTSTSEPNISNQTFAFYVRVNADAPVLPTPTISFVPSSITVNMGESVSNMASTDPSGLALTYYSDNESIASVDPDTGEVTGISRGTTTIHAVFAGNASYSYASATCEVNVVNPGDLYTITFKKGTTFTTNMTSYTSSTGFVNTCDGLSLTLRYINNGGDANWTEMRAGRSSGNTSTPTITSNNVIPEAIKTVTLSITQSNPDLVTSIRLLVSSNSNFRSYDAYDFNGKGPGDVTATVSSPATNKYYRIEIVLQKGSSNGFFRFDKIIYSE